MTDAPPPSFPRPPWFYLALPYLAGVTVHRPDRMDDAADGSLGYIVMTDTLGQSDDYRATLAGMWAKLAPGGVLAIGLRRGGPVSPDKVVEALPEAGVLERHEPLGAAPTHDALVLTKAAAPPLVDGRERIVIYRPGGFGDGLCAAAVAAPLRRAHPDARITFLTLEQAAEVVRHDPNLSQVLSYDPGRLSQGEDRFFQWVWSQAGTRWINLNRTYEDALLALPTDAAYDWPDAPRRAARVGVNAQELASAVAEVPYDPFDMRFHSTPDEADVAAQVLYAFPKDSLLVVYAVSGSSAHKSWPRAPEALATLLERFPGVVLALAGGPSPRDRTLSRAIVDGIGMRLGADATARRVTDLYLNGLSAREAFTVALTADLVIGPETGIHNAVAMTAVPQVVLLSHSTVANLTRDWRHVRSVVPRHPNYPCARMHLQNAECPVDPESGFGVCLSSVTVDDVLRAATPLLAARVDAAAD